MPKVQFISDKLAMLISSLCVIHCLLTPILIIALPSLASIAILNDETFHQIFLFFVLPIGATALFLGYGHHKNKRVAAAGTIGLVLLSSPLLVEWVGLGHEILGEYGEVLITVIASFIVVGAHIVNYRLGKGLQASSRDKREAPQVQSF